MAEVLIEQLRRMKAAEARRYKQKLARAVRRLIDIYNVEDWQELGIAGLDDESIYKWALEYCHGLTIGECIDRLEQEIAKHGFRDTMRRNIKTMEEEIRRLEAQAQLYHNLARVFGIPIELDEYTAEQLYRLYKHPEEDGELVRDIVSSYLQQFGYSEEEARRIAEESAKALERIAERKNRGLIVAHWTQILRAVHLRGMKAYEARSRLAKQVIERLKREGAEELILRLSEIEELIGGKVVQPRHSKTIKEAILRLQRAGAKEAVIGIRPGEEVYIFPFGSENPTCRVIRDKRTGAWIITECSAPVLIAKRTPRGLFYYAIEKQRRQRRWK